MEIKFSNITDQIIHIKMDDKNELAKAFIRFQEYYESPFPEIRNKIFTIGQLRSLGSREKKGVFTYTGGNTFDADWDGYNFPSYVLDPFIRGLFDPLTRQEQDIVEALKCKEGPFYVIGTYGEQTEGGPDDTMTHEICHALYYLNPKYKKEVDSVMAKHDLKNFKKYLRNMGYPEQVLNDECQAYMSADFDHISVSWKKELDSFKVKMDRKLHTDLKKIYKKHFKEEK